MESTMDSKVFQSLQAERLLADTAKMQGYKTIMGERMIFEAVFHYGKKQVFVVYVGSPSRLYPSAATLNFFNSVKANP